MDALEFSQVSKVFGGRRALDRVSLALPKGASLGLLGPNGAGKTTALRLLLGFARPSEGTVRLQGIDPRDPKARRGLGYLPERLRLPSKTGVRAFLRLHGKLCGLEGGDLERRIDEMGQLTGIDDRMSEKLGDLSKGLAQRAGFAAALLAEPSVLLLDEPNSRLDPIGMRAAREWIDAARKRGCTVLVCSHVLSEIERVCDRAAILDRGRVVAQGELDELLEPGETLEDAFVRLVGTA